jgi:hypothetical protein
VEIDLVDVETDAATGKKKRNERRGSKWKIWLHVVVAGTCIFRIRMSKTLNFYPYCDFKFIF